MSKYGIYGQECERLYVQKHRTLEQISELTGVSINTLSKWKQTSKWEEKRRAYEASPAGTVQALEDVLTLKIEQVRKLPAEAINSKLIDGLAKIVASIGKIRRGVDTLQATITVFDDFTRFLKDRAKKEEDKLEWLGERMREYFEYIRG